MKKLLYLGLFISLATPALVPVEGIILGEASPDYQTDPLMNIFSDIYDKTQVGENKKVKLYLSSYTSGENLYESCTYLIKPKYASSSQEQQAKRGVAATLQYIGLDTSIKAVGAYANKLSINEEGFQKLKKNLVRNYCSKNISIFSIRNIEKSLDYYYKNPFKEIIPSVENSPFATNIVINNSEKEATRSKEFDLVIKNFRAFCSWGGDIEDYRLMTPYLNNRFIMSFVIKNMNGVKDLINFRENRVTLKSSNDTVQVACIDLICRNETQKNFRLKFPLSVGSTGLATDLPKLYCHHFRFQNPPTVTLPEVKSWITKSELEDPIFETSQFISLMTGVPDFVQSADQYQELPFYLKSSIDDRWTKWAKTTLESFSTTLLFEESLKIKLNPTLKTDYLPTYGFGLEFSITLGEMDRALKGNDKIKMGFSLNLTKNYLRSLRSKIEILENNVDDVGIKALEKETSHYLGLQLKEKEKYFTQKMWNDTFSELIAKEIMRQASTYQGPLFNDLKEEIIKVPINFSYGLFAISYIRYRSDVAAGRLKLRL
jgi:hypothetical protein